MSILGLVQAWRKSWRPWLMFGSVILLIGGYQLFLMVQKVRDAANRSSDL